MVFRISESCYRYDAKLKAENKEIADWLLRLTDNYRTWGFIYAACVCERRWIWLAP